MIRQEISPQRNFFATMPLAVADSSAVLRTFVRRSGSYSGPRCQGDRWRADSHWLGVPRSTRRPFLSERQVMLLDKVDKKSVRAMVYVADKMKIEGLIFVSKSIRLIDELNVAQREFLAVSQATVTSLDSGELPQGFVILRKQAITCILLQDGEDHPVANDEGPAEMFRGARSPLLWKSRASFRRRTRITSSRFFVFLRGFRVS